MRRRPEYSALLSLHQVGLTWSGAGETPIGGTVTQVVLAPVPVAMAAGSPLAPPPLPAMRAPRPAAERTTTVPDAPLYAATSPFPTTTSPFPTTKSPFPTTKSPFPPFVDPFPPFVDPFTQPSGGTGGGGGPAQPFPVPPATGTYYPVTPADLRVADFAVNGPQARAVGLSGAGLKIGIISDSFDENGSDGYARDVTAGLLPKNVTVLQDGPAGSSDEGRAMAQLVHATAPDAQIYFDTSGETPQAMGEAVSALQAAGCKIIVDDVIFFTEPMFQDAGPIDTAIDTAVAAGTDYFTAAGNYGNSVYQAACTPVNVNIAGLGPVTAQTFANGATTQSVTIAGGTEATLTLEWDAPYETATDDPIQVVVLSGTTPILTSVQSGNAPVVVVGFPVLANDATYNIAILYDTTKAIPGLFKYELLGDDATINNPLGGEPTGAVLGHAMLSGVNAVGAIYYGNTPSQGGTLTPESFSDAGGSQFLFAPGGARLSAPIASNGPEFLAPDGAQTSSLDPFFGTSAAAPVAAATAALMLQANGALSTSDVTALLEDSALPTPSSDGAAGAGLIQADLATKFASTGVISGSQQLVIRGTSQTTTIESGTGGHWLLPGSGATLVEAQGIDTVMAGTGSDTVDLTGSDAFVYGNTGPLWVRTMLGVDTVIGTSGAMTVSGGAGGGIIFGSTAPGDILTAGAEKTVIVAMSANDVLTGVGQLDLLYASAAGNDTLNGGADTEILAGTSGGSGDVFNAGSGTPLIAPFGSSGTIVLGNADATVLEGTGATDLRFTQGQNGGFDVVYDFDPTKDLLLMSGWSSQQAAVEQAVAKQYDTGGTSWLTLPDGTVVAFVGLNHLSASNVTFG